MTISHLVITFVWSQTWADYGIEDDGAFSCIFWSVVANSCAFAKRIESAGEILTMLNEELTKEEIDQSIQILTEINKDLPEMLWG